jgi:hypothetical protein
MGDVASRRVKNRDPVRDQDRPLHRAVGSPGTDVNSVALLLDPGQIRNVLQVNQK